MGTPNLPLIRRPCPEMPSPIQVLPCAKGLYFPAAAVTLGAMFRTGASVYAWAGESRGQVFMPSMALCVPAHSAEPSDSRGASPQMSVQARHWLTALTVLRSPAKAKAALPLPRKGARREPRFLTPVSTSLTWESHPSPHPLEPFKGRAFQIHKHERFFP